MPTSPDVTGDAANTSRHGEDVNVIVAVTSSHLRLLPSVGARA